MRHLGLVLVTVLTLTLGSCSGRTASELAPDAATPRAQSANPASEETGRQVLTPAPLVDDSPSVVKSLTEDPTLMKGVYLLSTRLPPVVDGDTIRVDGLDASLRLLGLDTEETFKGDNRLEAEARRTWKAYLMRVNEGADPTRPPKYGTPMGEEAREFAEMFFKGLTHVRLEYDHPKKTRGYYNRHLVHVLTNKNGRWVHYNVEAVRQGYSPYFVKYGQCHRYDAAFRAAEQEARHHRRGIWASQPTSACYPDYPARLKWWTERDAAIQRMNRLIATRPDIFVLGEPDAWEKLKTKEGEKVTILGTLDGSRFDKKESRTLGAIGLLYMSHKNRTDFVLVGPAQTVENHPIRKHGGDLLLITGTVSLHRGNPQFAIDTVEFRPL